jgi:chromosome segregation ATPase
VAPSDLDRESVERRLDAVERALTDERSVERVDELDEIETRVAELEAAVQALRGYVGSVRAVNEDVERRADRALRRAEALERHVGPTEADHDSISDPDHDSNPDPDPTDGSADASGALGRLRNRL